MNKCDKMYKITLLQEISLGVTWKMTNNSESYEDIMMRFFFFCFFFSELD